MIAEDLKGWGQLLATMRDDESLLARAANMNEWFTPDSIQLAIEAMLPWFGGNLLTDLRNKYPTVGETRRIGLILAGNLPFVGLHDVLMVLLSGHVAVVKPSHKDAVLLLRLLERSSPEIQRRVSIVDRIFPNEVDFLIATGSNTTARQIEASFAGIPQLIRKSRFSVAVLDGNESESALTGLADDVLMYHGLGCRSVASILIPNGYDMQPLNAILDRHLPHALAPAWHDVVRFERAKWMMTGARIEPCQRILVLHGQTLRPGGIGVLRIVTYSSDAECAFLLAGAESELQCTVGAHYIPLGQAQRPRLDDFADGIDTLQSLTGLA